MKRYILSILLILLFPVMVFAKEDKLVKVYVYEAGGCPYCEKEIEYLKGLSSYNKKFKIVQKELYVDHVNWAHGKDYETGAKVANTFKAAGFNDASYYGTPFVVISDVYAATGYSTSLEDAINDAYEKGDKDIVKCIEDGKEECIKGVTAEDVAKVEEENNTSDDQAADNRDTTASSYSKTASGDIIWTVIACTLVNIAVYVVKTNKDKKDIIEHLSNK